MPLHDVWVIELAGGGPGRTLRDVEAFASRQRQPLPVRALFGLRFFLGRLLRLDAPRPAHSSTSYPSRLTDDDRARSRVTPGTPFGPFRTMYVFDHEAVYEARNATVHAFLAMALRPHPTGYTLYWGIYVKPVGPITACYMALIDPFRRFIIYPAMIRQTKAAWARAYGGR